MPRSSAEVPEPVGDYHDADGFVFRGVPLSEVQEGWVELTREQQEHVQPLSKFDARRFEANVARENPSAKTRRGRGIGKRVDCGVLTIDAPEPALDVVAIDNRAGTITVRPK